MTKQEKIKEVWGEYYEEVKNKIDEHGVILTCPNNYPNIEFDSDSFGYIKPKSLEGIEDNAGWIKIESEADRYPNKDVWISNFNGNGIAFFHDALKLIPKEYTHYQPIEKPKPPLY